MPADSTYSSLNGKKISSDAKPSIQMDRVDHKNTESNGRGNADSYRKLQNALIQSGKIAYMAALQVDIDNIRGKFGSKYDTAIAQMPAWTACKDCI